MPIYRLDERLWFPPPERAVDGVLAVGGDLRPERILLAYKMGIFPWYSEGRPIVWHSPDPRMVLEFPNLHVPKSLAKEMRRGRYTVTLDTCFRDVMIACGEAPRVGQAGTWITEAMLESYCELHARGFAHSIEAWEEGVLVGGLYGVAIGTMFYGESMFARAPDASKVAFVTIAEQLRRWGFALIDCQVYTEHLARFGADEWPRKRFLTLLREAVAAPGRPGPWRFDP